MSKKRIHNLKIQRQYLEALVSGIKKCELRINDRDYQKGDILAFDEEILWQGEKEMPSQVVGKKLQFEVTHVLSKSMELRGLTDNHVILSVKKL